ncbi:ATP-binding protein [Pyrococcus kukulkanii]|uniref:ATP-binding protein n=1 Tax=Pyrococcus kukulkanii TaxID=1609559 RepID=A0A127BBG4_9EURY|nr:ATP-binding protein [Pyrococcus kukulkanii]AMM54139.1 ATP-binding protein [Pyrococcus kukulkanii]
MFFDREEELRALLSLISYEPNMITFVYGPINSGKTALIDEFIKRLPNDYLAFKINFRRSPITGYEEFVDVLFSLDLRNNIRTLKDAISLVLSVGKEVFGFPIPSELFERIVMEKKPKNAFTYIATLMEEIRRAGKNPILIVDELQVIGDLKVNGPLIYELFNFFVHLTKEEHLAHVFVVTSDSLFIEKVYNEAMLQGRVDYFLVDDFDKETSLKFLVSQGFTNDEAELVWSYFGGKPVYLVEALKHREELKEWCEGTLEAKFHWLLYSLNSLRRTNKELFEEVLSLLVKFRENEEVECLDINEAVAWTVKNNVLFLDPRRGILRPQGRLELLAIRKALEKL